MAKTRMINTRIWNDGYVAELDPTEKLLFIYLLTNQATSICGIYELPIRTAAFETGIEEEKVRNILSRFGLEKKIYYVDGWVVVKNFIKHQNQGSPKVLRGIEIELAAVPEKLKGYVYGIDTLSHPNSNLNLNSNLKKEAKPTASISYLSDIPQEKLKELTETYEVSTAQVKKKALDLVNYCAAKGKTYKNYHAFLENALSKDFGRRVKLQPKAEEVEMPLDAEAQARVAALKVEIGAVAKRMTV